MRGSTALESANALFRRAQTPPNAERLSTNIWDGVTATRSTRRWLHRGRAFAVAPSSFALDIPHVAFSTGEGISQRKAESSVSFSGARACARAGAGVAWRPAFFSSADFRGYLVLQAASATAPAERLRKNVHECTPTKRNLSWGLAVQPRAAAGSACQDVGENAPRHAPAPRAARRSPSFCARAFDRSFRQCCAGRRSHRLRVGGSQL